MNSAQGDSGRLYRGSAIELNQKELVKKPTARKGWCSEQMIQVKQRSGEVRGRGGWEEGWILAGRACKTEAGRVGQGRLQTVCDDLLRAHALDLIL